MSQDAIKVGIVADDKTGKGIKSAKKNLSSLEKSAISLGKTFASVFAAQKLIQYSKLSAKAAAADQASAAKLANAVKNLGLQYANPYIADFIASMEKQTKVADDELRPAFQTLITQTGELAKSQELLTTAINVSRGSGESLSTVVNDISQAFVGNTKGLKKYYLGLTNAELAAASFEEIQGLLNKQFAGGSQSYLSTYQGQLDTISLSFDNLKESAGRAFFTLIGGEGGSSGGAQKFANLLDYIGLGAEIASQKISDFFYRMGHSQNEYDAYIANRNAAPAPVPGRELFLKSSVNKTTVSALEKARLALIKKQLDAQKKLTEQQKKQAMLKKQSGLFDMEQIQLIAALKGKLSDEDRKRVELQLAILQGNEDKAKKLSDEIANSIDKTGNLAKYLATLPDARNPFGYLDSYLIELKKKADAIFYSQPVPQPSNLPETEYNQGTYVPSSGYVPPTNTDEMPQSNVDPTTPSTGNFGGFPQNQSWWREGGFGAASVNVFLDSKQIAAGIQDQSLNGNQTTINRSQGNFG